MTKYQPSRSKTSGLAVTGARFIISNRIAGKRDVSLQKASRDAFDTRFQETLAANIDILGDSAKSRKGGEAVRRVIFFEGDQVELAQKRKDLSADFMIEPERPRIPMLFNPLRYLATSASPAEVSTAAILALAVGMPAGAGATLELKVSAGGKPVKGAAVTLLLASKVGGQSTQEQMPTGDGGSVSLQYDSSVWTPIVVLIEPTNGFWPAIVRTPASGQEVVLTPLPDNGPMGWWQALAGCPGYSETRGQGIRVGIVDTGFGPNPNLAQVKSAGAFIEGAHLTAPTAANDVANHGTHVTGIIGARPQAGSTQFGGIASGADIVVARVFPKGQPANQGDIASAIDDLVANHQVDLINLSLGGSSSDIEQDAVIAAFEQGTLCICAAGNNQGGPVLFPAAYPQAVAISALGLMGTTPPGSASSANVPTQPDKFTTGAFQGLYLAAFSNVGPQVAAITGGNGIISTVPATDGVVSPYLAMDGTSMASPVATATLAACLSTDATYRNQPKTTARAAYAMNMLRGHAISLGLNSLYQGAGLARI
jgi:subtilisin family serine protease